MAPLKKASLVDQLYNQIKNNIINLSYPLGSKLNVNELQGIYGVSSTPLREALARLQAEGLIIYENNVGARVIDLEPKDVLDIHGLVLTMHKMAVRLAMENADHQLMADEMAGYVKGYQAARSADVEIRNIADFIGTFYRHCGNTRLDNSMKGIQGQQLLLRYLYRRQLGARGDKADHFAKIEKAVRAGNTERILEILSANYERGTATLMAALEGRKKTAG